MATKLETVLTRAGDDESFREALLADASATLASTGLTLSDDDRAVLDEYCRVAATMTKAQLDEAIRALIKTRVVRKIAAST